MLPYQDGWGTKITARVEKLKRLSRPGLSCMIGRKGRSSVSMSAASYRLKEQTQNTASEVRPMITDGPLKNKIDTGQRVNVDVEELEQLTRERDTDEKEEWASKAESAELRTI